MTLKLLEEEADPALFGTRGPTVCLRQGGDTARAARRGKEDLRPWPGTLSAINAGGEEARTEPIDIASADHDPCRHDRTQSSASPGARAHRGHRQRGRNHHRGRHLRPSGDGHGRSGRGRLGIVRPCRGAMRTYWPVVRRVGVDVPERRRRVRVHTPRVFGPHCLRGRLDDGARSDGRGGGGRRRIRSLPRLLLRHADRTDRSCSPWRRRWPRPVSDHQHG